MLSQKTYSSSILSQGAWIGLGITIGLIVVGSVITGLLWLYIHFKGQMPKMMEAKPPVLSQQQVTENPEGPLPRVESQEVDGSGIVREAPDNPLFDLPARPAELPTNPWPAGLDRYHEKELKLLGILFHVSEGVGPAIN